ncbi:tripartite tricarboxylate transporter substrate binding protein [Escherichia fergusonii]|uniref:tripartite tricarboxylate transporter substrate binding protein n=1 Tax=Escherichia fergusonii TaxID=564 RepID=UPI0015EEC458|nr:tripartite tricarboxylate transporter substrate binding protein [Escherichia fergusonii]QMI36610.1 tripartite tricarboxylate transporter substrate binding protein [Escherichia fergusonii]QMI40675.1 tripartite tricarboxylate transporter substrate binding protein [Escherichia fergusonii]
MKTRTILASLITCSLSFSAYAATDWPTKPVEFVITASAGGDTDMNARLLAKYFKEVAGVPLVITNMPGSAGSIATTNVKNAAADGTKAVFCHTGHMVINKMTGIVDYNYKDFDIATIAGMNRTYVLTASKKSGINSLDDLIAKAKAEPGKVIYGTEFGGLTYTQGLKLEQMAGIKLKTVDAGTAADRVIGLLSGRIDLGVVAYSAVKDYQTTGKMTILAQGGPERNPLFGDFPTFVEKGINYTSEFPYVVAFPKGTNPEILQKMGEIIKKIQDNPKYQEELRTSLQQEPFWLDRAQANAYLDKTQQELEPFKDMLKSAKK